MSAPAQITLSDLKLGRTQAAALRKKAERFGLTPSAYVKQLIAEDLELDSIAARVSFNEVAAPFRKALSGLSDEELNALARPHKWRRKTKR